VGWRVWSGQRKWLVVLILAAMAWAAWQWGGVSIWLAGGAAALLSWIFIHSRAARLDIQEFGVEGLKEKIGKDFAVMLRSRLFELAAPSRGDSWSLTQGQVSTIAIPAEVSTLVPGGDKWLKAVPALWKWLSTRRALVLTGELHPPGAHGVGVTVELMEGPRYLSGHTIWQKEFGLPPTEMPDEVTAQDFYGLAEVAAVWLLFELARQS
jgi:hypothetical protein